MKKLGLSALMSMLLLLATACRSDGISSVSEQHSSEPSMTEGAPSTTTNHSEAVSTTGFSAVTEADSYIPGHPGYYMDFECDGYDMIGYETDYSNIIGYTEYDEYNSNEAVVRYFTKNTNKNTGYWYHIGVNVQYYDGTEWITLPYVGNGEIEDFGWMFYYGTDEEGYVIDEGRIDLNEKLAVKVVSGDYRLVRFLADRELYIYFTIV